jgi:ubiquinone/menaquinone biosynthesis C-methylase UbiE
VNSPYYLDAEKWTFLFWDKDRLFRRLFDQMHLGDVLELACGYGRHAEQCAPLAQRLTLVDVIQENLDICRRRLSGFSNLDYRLGSGTTYPGVPDASLDAIYCYDAMVHFSPDIVTGYLKDTARVLRPGGMALFHHSNYAEGKGKVWSANPHARNYMTVDLFSGIAAGAGLQVVEAHPMDWGGAKNIDGVTLLQR